MRHSASISNMHTQVLLCCSSKCSPTKSKWYFNLIHVLLFVFRFFSCSYNLKWGYCTYDWDAPHLRHHTPHGGNHTFELFKLSTTCSSTSYMMDDQTMGDDKTACCRVRGRALKVHYSSKYLATVDCLGERKAATSRMRMQMRMMTSICSLCLGFLGKENMHSDQHDVCLPTI